MVIGIDELIHGGSKVAAAHLVISKGKPSRGKWRGTIMIRWRNKKVYATNVYTRTYAALVGTIVAQVRLEAARKYGED